MSAVGGWDSVRETLAPQEGRHHWPIDGISGVDVIAALMATKPHAGLAPAKPWVACRALTGRDLLRGEIERRTRPGAA